MIRKSQYLWSRLRVGLLALGAIGLLIAASISIEGSTSLFQTSYRAHFDDVIGLKIGAPVRIAGLDVGHIDDVRLLDDVLMVEVLFSIENTVTDRLRSDASAIVRSMSVLGDKILAINPGTPLNPLLNPDAILPGHVEPEIAGIAPSAESTMMHLTQALLEIKTLVTSIRRGEGTLGSLVANDAIYVQTREAIQTADDAAKGISELVTAIEHGDGTVGKLVSSGELHDRLVTVTERMNQVLVRFNQPDGTLARVATDDGELYHRLDAIATHGEHVLARLDTGEGTVGKLLKDEDVYARAEKILSDVEQLIADVQANPTKYFKFSIF